MNVDAPEEFFDWLDRIEAKARGGDQDACRTLARAADALSQLRILDGPPPSGRRCLTRVNAEGLADIRKASNLTQQQVAATLDTDQGTVSRIERRDDLLLSTLRQYLAATGAEHAKIVIDKDGVEIALDLDTFA